MDAPRPKSPPIHSEFASDPDMAELVQLFVSEMPSRVEALNAAIREKKFADLQRQAHQLKGASGGYGFGVIGDQAGRLENLLKQNANAHESALDTIRKQVDELVSLCLRASSR